ncbi:MAG TPA: DoxX family protein [Xanthomonadaceae bacterium]|nr:DoxX family protein [Xanthomonadaceae bacterium]
MNRLIERWHTLVERLEGVGRWLAPLGLRVLLFWEFFEAGREKYTGSNWFMDIQGRFPFPFDRVPADLSWAMATWSELVLSLLLLVGLATRFAAFGLFVLTVVATAAVHWPADWSMLEDLLRGYAIRDSGHGNFKLPLIFMIMLVPLILRGGGWLSVDALIAHRVDRGDVQPLADMTAWGLALLGLGLPLAMLVPVFGSGLVLLGAVLLALGRWLRP